MIRYTDGHHLCWLDLCWLEMSGKVWSSRGPDRKGGGTLKFKNHRIADCRVCIRWSFKHKVPRCSVDSSNEACHSLGDDFVLISLSLLGRFPEFLGRFLQRLKHAFVDRVFLLKLVGDMLLDLREYFLLFGVVIAGRIFLKQSRGGKCFAVARGT